MRHIWSNTLERVRGGRCRRPWLSATDRTTCVSVAPCDAACCYSSGYNYKTNSHQRIIWLVNEPRKPIFCRCEMFKLKFGVFCRNFDYWYLVYFMFFGVGWWVGSSTRLCWGRFVPLENKRTVYWRSFRRRHFVGRWCCRDHSGYGSSQRETILQCNVVFHWLWPYPWRFLYFPNQNLSYLRNLTTKDVVSRYFINIFHIWLSFK